MLRILIVDDMPIFLDYLKGCIDWETYGFEICGEAHDGVEALSMIETTFPDIILTDITMPYMDGLELSEKIAKHYPDISVLLITGNNEFEYARRAVKIGVCDYIVKPFEKEELLLSLLKQKDNIDRAIEAIFGEDFHPYLRSMFKQETSQTITEYITKYRMTLAKELIETTDDKLTTISEKVGFNDVSYFSKSFKKYYGVTPKSFSTSGE